MKRLITTISLFTLALSLFLACKREQVEVYDPADNGIYFNNGSGKNASQRSINFADLVLGRPKETPIKLRIKTLGTKADTPRKVVLSTKALDELGEAKVTLPEIVIDPDTLEKTITVLVHRPEVRDSTFAVVIYVDTEHQDSQFGSTIAGADEYTIFVRESYSKPKGWDGLPGYYLGSWSAEKHLFFVDLFKDNNFYKSNDYSKFTEWNVQAVDSVRVMQEANLPAEQLIAIPFLSDNARSYKKPWYWGTLQDRYLGSFSSEAFAGLAQALSLDTTNEHTKLKGTEEEMKKLNKLAVRMMMEKYNQFYNDGWRSGASYKSSFLIPYVKGVEYDLVQPRHWSDVPGGGDLIKKYYGEYSPEKYKFMIEVFLELKGDDFVLNHMFPVQNMWGDVKWDGSIGGEKAIKTYNQLFREKLQNYNGEVDFTFPVIQE